MYNNIKLGHKHPLSYISVHALPYLVIIINQFNLLAGAQNITGA